MGRTKALLLFLCSCMVLPALTGCGPKRLKADFVGFESAYAQTSNREVLLNLARLQNHDPTYFFKIGQISSLYRMQASVTGNASYALQSSNVNIGGPTGGGSPLANYENDPSFTFIPVNDETNAKFLLQPVDPDTFYALYQEGWRVDQLFRLMVDRIELTTIVSPGVCDVKTLRNVPPAIYAAKPGATGPAHVVDPEALSSYVTFLRISAVLYELQKHGDLVLSGTSTFLPYDQKSSLKDDEPSSDEASGGPRKKASSPAADSAATPAKGKTPTATDMMTAMEKNAVWEKNNGSWTLGQKVPSAIFYLNHYKGGSDAPNTDISDIQKIGEDVLAAPGMEPLQLNHAAMLKNVLSILANGFSISGVMSSQNSNIGPCPPTQGPGISSHLVMRSLLGIMAAAAQEQAPFDDLLRSTDIQVPAGTGFESVYPGIAQKLCFSTAGCKAGTGGPNESVSEIESVPHSFKSTVPEIEQAPLLRLTGMSEFKRTPPLVQISYRGKTYEVADMKLKDQEVPENQYWNRDVFRLVDQLTSQVTVDISKFPLPAILQLNTQ